MRTLILCSLVALAACSPESDHDASEDGEAPEIAVSVTRDIQALPPSEITVGAAGASAGTGGGAASTATTSSVRSSNAAVQRVFSEFNARQTASGIVLTLPESVLFDFDEATLRSDARTALGKIQAVLAEYPDAPVEIVGHTDAKGTDAYNQDLSTRRAESVRAWLAEQGVPGSRLTATGRGESEPVAENETPDGSDNPAGRQQNRRVEIVIEGVQGTVTGDAGQPTSTLRTTPADSSR